MNAALLSHFALANLTPNVLIFALGGFAYFLSCISAIVCGHLESKYPSPSDLRSFVHLDWPHDAKHLYNLFRAAAAAHNNGVFPRSSRHSTLWPHSALNNHLIQSMSSFRMESNTCLNRATIPSPQGRAGRSQHIRFHLV